MIAYRQATASINDNQLRRMAVEAFALTVQYFGRTVKLYAPLYLSNYCLNACPYCGYSGTEYDRKTLRIDEIKSEAEIIAQSGIQEILLVAGDDPEVITSDYLEKAVIAVKAIVPSVSIETAPLEESEYRLLNQAGLDGVTLYQETYNQKLYHELHKGGNKEDFAYRYDALFRAARAGIRRIGMGVLLGLTAWQEDWPLLMEHARQLQVSNWRSTVSISFPRINPCLAGYNPPVPVSDRELLHLVCISRLAMPQSDLILSTREAPAMRNNLPGLGITKMSAGSRTAPGGYGTSTGHSEQFEVSDDRSPQAIADMLLKQGFQPVWQDWEYCMR